MKQHYVPRVYLKFFATEKKSEFRTDVYDINTKRNFSTNIKNICAEKDLYTLDENSTAAKHRLSIENMYGKWFEPLYKKAYDILTNPNITKITHKQHGEILLGIFHLYFRNPRFVKNATKHHKLEIKRLYQLAKQKKEKGISYLEEDFSFREYTLEEIQNFIIDKITTVFKEKHLLGFKEICENHQLAKLEVSEIKCASEFFTSDNPLIAEDFVSTQENPLLKTNEFNIPINKKFFLRIFHDNTRKLNFIYRNKISKGIVAVLNDNTYKSSSRFIIGSKMSFDEFFKIKKILDDDSLDMKINAIKQILEIEEINNHDDEVTKLMRNFVNKFEEQGTLTKLDEYNFMTKMRKFNVDLKKERIK